MHRTEAELLLDRVGLRPGDRALDLGCGPLGVLDLLAERVGPTGRVVGIDREKRYLAIARQELDARGLGGVELVAADATGTDLEPASFDLVHERLVLNNVPRPDAVVDEMVRLTRPGGHVAVQDVDWLTWTCLPEHADWDRAPREGRGGVERGRAPGRRLPALLRGRRVWSTSRWCRTCACSGPASPTTGCWCGSSRCTAPASSTAGRRPRLSWTPPSRAWRATSPTPSTVVLYATFFQAWGRRS